MSYLIGEKQRTSLSLSDLVSDFCNLLNEISFSEIEMANQLIVETISRNGCIYICGNGGSGANANLFATLLSMYLKVDEFGLHILSLNSNMSLLTAASEMYGYDKVFSWQLNKLAKSSDLLICISGSGNSPNILEAVETTKRLEMSSIGLSGMGGGKLAKIVDFPIIVNSDSMEQIENVHTVILYSIATSIRQHISYGTGANNLQSARSD